MKRGFIFILALMAYSSAFAEHGSAVAECSRLGNASAVNQCIAAVSSATYFVPPRAVRGCVSLGAQSYQLACIHSVSQSTRPLNGADIEACARLGNMSQKMSCVRAVTGT